MKRKILIILAFFLSILIILNFIFSDCAFSIRINWNISIPYISFYKQIYHKDSGPSFNGDGTRYHIFSYKNEKYIEKMLKWKNETKDIDFIEKELDKIKVSEKDRPNYSECKYWYNEPKDTLDRIIICWNKFENKLYIFEFFI